MRSGDRVKVVATGAAGVVRWVEDTLAGCSLSVGLEDGSVNLYTPLELLWTYDQDEEAEMEGEA